MDERTQNAQTEREQLIQSLTRSIVDSAKPHIDPATPQADIDKQTREINERLQFESNVALSELVTRFSRVKPLESKPAEERTFLRFGRNFRAQHMLMFTSVILLILTGMPLKFPEFDISKFMIVTVFGGLQNSTLIHRIAAVGLIIVGAWHVGYIIRERMI